MKVAHIIQSISPNDGGPPSVVMHLAAAQANLGAEVQVVTYAGARNQDWWSNWIEQIPAIRQIELQEVERAWYHPRSQVRTLRRLRNDVDILHVHGIWRSLAWYALSGKRHGRGVTVLAPHGMLSPWALKHRGLKKKLALSVLWRRLIASADMLHAVSTGEQQELEAVISAARIALIPNGISVAEAANGIAEIAHPADAPNPSAGYVLYLARLHAMKGPDLLLDAFARLLGDCTECADYKLIMAGPDYGAQTALLRQARRLGIEDKVEFPGAVFGKAKQDLYRRAALVCQPSRYEAFSLSLLESLAAGVTVLTTPEANFPEIQTCGAGVICRGESLELARNMRLLLTQPEMREQMGRRGRDLVHREFTWERIASRSMQSYEDLLRGALPSIAR